MSDAPLPLLIERAPDGALVVRAPAVGVVTIAVEDGALVGSGAVVGTLTRIRSRRSLVLPDGGEGRVASVAKGDRSRAAGYGEELFRIVPLVDSAKAAPAPRARKAAVAGRAVVAPTAGVFYRAPTAGAAAYVAPGSRVRRGQPIGLIEVMKTFNPIPYGGEGLPDEAEVVEILAGDGEEVRAGQPLVAVR